MLYLIDVPQEECLKLDNSMKLLDKKQVSSDSLAGLNTKILPVGEPILIAFSEITENLISLLKDNARIDLFFSLGEDPTKFSSFSLNADNRYLGTWNIENPGVTQSIVGLYRFLRNQRLKENFYFKKIEDLKSELKSVVGLLEKEVYFSRDRYKKIRKKLMKTFGSLNFSSIYKIGLNSGSEINEIFEKSGKTYWISFSTSSYAASADFIRILEDFIRSEDKIEEFKDTILNLVEKNHFDSSSLKTFILEIDPKNLFVKGYMWGNYYFLSTNKSNIHFPKMIPVEREFLNQAKIELKLERNEKAILISPGVLKNFNQVRDQDSLVKFCLSHIEKGNEDLLDELLIELKIKYNDDFFENDSFLTYIEVSPNAILSID